MIVSGKQFLTCHSHAPDIAVQTFQYKIIYKTLDLQWEVK